MICLILLAVEVFEEVLDCRDIIFELDGLGFSFLPAEYAYQPQAMSFTCLVLP